MEKERIVNVHPKEYKGKQFRSSLEAQTAQTLDELGIPYAYEEKKILLLEGFRSPFQKDKVRSIYYVPDFQIGPILLECKGFETPEWKIKKKLLFKYLQENEPQIIFYQIHDAKKSLLQILDKHWPYLGYAVQVTPMPKKASKKKSAEVPKSKCFDSIQEAMYTLGIQGKALGPILNSLSGKKEYVYGYNWKIKQITL